jgi:hypothetical protein
MFLIWISDLVDMMGCLPEHVKEMQTKVVLGYMNRPKYWGHVLQRARFNLSM